jgi:hypothetical protein
MSHMDDASLATMLGKTKPHWDVLLARLAGECPSHAREWKNYGKKHGWQLKVSSGKRSLVYLVPEEGGFRALMALRAGAVGALRDAGLPAELVDEIEGAKVYPEGRPVRVTVKTKQDADVVKKLVALKLASDGSLQAGIRPVGAP